MRICIKSALRGRIDDVVGVLVIRRAQRQLKIRRCVDVEAVCERHTCRCMTISAETPSTKNYTAERKVCKQV